MVKKVGKFLGKLLSFCVLLIVAMIIIFCICRCMGKEQQLMDLLDQIKQEFTILVGNKSLQEQEAEAFVELKDENLNTEVEKAKCYYYMQLNDIAKQFYVIFENNVERFKNNEDNIKLPTSISDNMKKAGGQDSINQAFQDAWDAFIKDKPELFYFDGNKFCLLTKTINKGTLTSYELYIGKGDNANYYCEGFNSIEDVNAAEIIINNVQQNVINNVATGNTYNKILQVHNYIVANVEYDQTLKKVYNGNIYGALGNKTAICEGYAKVFKYFMDKLDIPCVIVCGIAVDENGKEEKHAWNYVYLNGIWYAIDTTWDDPIIVGKGKSTDAIKYKYFLKGSETMKLDHLATGVVTDGGKVFSYPEINKTNY